MFYLSVLDPGSGPRAQARGGLEIGSGWAKGRKAGAAKGGNTEGGEEDRVQDTPDSAHTVKTERLKAGAGI